MAELSTTESQQPPGEFVDSYRLVRDFEEQWMEADGSYSLKPGFVSFMGAVQACHVQSDNGVVLHYEVYGSGAHGSGIEWLGSGGELAGWLRRQAGTWKDGAPKCYREDKAGFCGVVFYFGPRHVPDLVTAMGHSRALSFRIDMDFTSGREGHDGGK